MLFEPTPIQTTRRGRWRTVATLAIPVVLLSGVVGAALAGSRDPSVAERDRAVAPAVSSAPLVDAPNATPTAETAATTAIRFPARTYDLPIGTVAATIDAVQHGRLLMNEVVAIRGWLSVQVDGRGCAPSSGPLSLTDGLCWSSGVLRDDAAPAFRWVDGKAYATDARGTALDPWIPPGVARWGLDLVKAAPAADGSINGPIEPVPVVLIGTFHWPRTGDCTTGSQCAPGLVVERIVWVDGEWRTRPLVQALDPVRGGLDATESRQVALDAYPGRTIVLSQTLVPSAMLARVDPDAALETRAPMGADRLWYLRLMLPAPDPSGPPRSVQWVAIDDRTGTIIATQPAG